MTIEELEDGESIYSRIDEVTAAIKAETGPLSIRHILWRGEDELWDLLLLESPRLGIGMAIFSIECRTLAEARTRLRELVAKGVIAEKIR